MSKLLSGLARHFGELFAAWNRFWFEPMDPIVLSAIRVCAGLMLLYTHQVWTLDLDAFFGPQGWIPASSASAAQTELAKETYFPTAFWSHLWWCDSPGALWATHLAALGVFFCLAIGFCTRTMSVLAYLLAVSYVHRVLPAFFGLDKINCMLAMYLMLGPSGAYFSVDRWLARRKAGGMLALPRPSISANIAVRLIQLHMCIIYLFSGLDKLQGLTWWDGTAIWQSVANYEYQSLDMTWLAGWPKLVSIITHVTVFWEVFYCVLVWNRLARPTVLALAVLVHGGIAISMGMMTFGLAMLIGNMAFLSPSFVHSLAAMLPESDAPQPEAYSASAGHR